MTGTAGAPRRLMIANRGEIAVRIAATAAELGVASVAVFSEDDAGAPHVRATDAAEALPGAGPAAYLDAGALVAAALRAGCDAVHPGYGFLSESAAFAAAVEAAGLLWVGPSPAALAAFGDKARAREVARAAGAPVLEGTGAVDLAAARAFFAGLGPGAAVMVKAVAGGGGRGVRPVFEAAALEGAMASAAAEAKAAFGDGAVYLERLVRRARHVEVQIAADGVRAVALGDRECSVQRRRQKVLEVAPAPGLPEGLRARLFAASEAMAEAVGYRGVGTFEFLLDGESGEAFFIEANARLQVEHTVTEEVTGLDLVAVQLRLAAGETLDGLGLRGAPAAVGAAVQARLCAEATGPDGAPRPAVGVLTEWAPPGGPGVRVDAAAEVGMAANPRFDSLLAKVVCRGADLPGALARLGRALDGFGVAGIETNLDLLRGVAAAPEVAAGTADTGFLEANAAALMAAGAARGRRGAAPAVAAAGPVAVAAAVPEGMAAVRAPLTGTVASVAVAEGAAVTAGAPVLALEAMKMEHLALAPEGGRVARVLVRVGETVAEGAPLALIAPGEAGEGAAAAEAEPEPDVVRPDLAEALARRAATLDAARPEAVARRRAKGRWTARETLGALLDPGSFEEYGGLVVAGRRTRMSEAELIARTPADGVIAGFGRVNGAEVGEDRAGAAVIAYDYTVLAGTQGMRGHQKTDRFLEAVHWRGAPVVVFAEGGGGRPGDTDMIQSAGLNVPTFHRFAELSGEVPLVGVNAGFCFAGNAVLLGACDVVISTRGSSLGMGGPAMIEGGGLGVYRPEEVGPAEVQAAAGVVDLLVEDDAGAVAAAKKYLGYFQGPVADWSAADQRRLRHVVPENRRRVYEMRRVIELLADEGSVLELRREFGGAMITALARIEGRPLGIVANDPKVIGGAIDAPAADKGARFLQLCEAHGLPVLFLCDTPGNMVGPEAERTGLIRHCARLFLVGAALTVPYVTVVTRKGYGLGAQAMAGGGFANPLWTVAWPTGEFGAMGLEGATRLGFRAEFEAIEDPVKRAEAFEARVVEAYAVGRGLNAAALGELDDVIDPAETRARVRRAMDAPRRKRAGRRWIDSW